MADTRGRGYYSGVQDYQDLQSQMRNRESEIRLRELQAQKLQEDRMQEQETAALLKRAYERTTSERVGEAEEAGLNETANQTRAAAKAISGVDPKSSIELSKLADSQEKTASEVTVRNVEMKKAKLAAGADVIATVYDQASLDDALSDLAKNGVIIPPRFKNTYSPELKDWLAHREIFSKSLIDSLQLKNQTTQVEINEKEVASKEADRLVKQKAAERKETISRARIKSGEANIKEETIAYEATFLSKNDDAFDNLSREDKHDASKHAIALANSYLTEGMAESYPEAIAMARTEIKSRIDPETNTYKGFEAEAKAKTNKPTLEDFLNKAQKANPTVSVGDLTKYYNKKYK